MGTKRPFAGDGLRLRSRAAGLFYQPFKGRKPTTTARFWANRVVAKVSPPPPFPFGHNGRCAYGRVNSLLRCCQVRLPNTWPGSQERLLCPQRPPLQAVICSSFHRRPGGVCRHPLAPSPTAADDATAAGSLPAVGQAGYRESVRSIFAGCSASDASKSLVADTIQNW